MDALTPNPYPITTTLVLPIDVMTALFAQSKKRGMPVARLIEEILIENTRNQAA